jgi:two-component system, sensor histidine kinase PdtaS
VGDLPAEIATPLAVVLVELLQNAVEHGFPDGRVGRVRVEMGNEGGELRAVVADNGVGFPDGFSLTAADSLGLTIVRTLITSELGGVIATRNDGGAVVEVRVRSTSEPRVGR